MSKPTQGTELNPDQAFTDTHYHTNLLSNDIIGSEGRTIVGISFETSDAKEFIETNWLKGLGAIADPDNKAVHIPLTEHQTHISFVTQNGATLDINQTGDFSYHIGGAHTTSAEHFDYLIQDNVTGDIIQADLDMNAIVHPDKLIALGSHTGFDDALNPALSTIVLPSQGDNQGDQYIIDMNHATGEKIVIMDLGITKENVLSFVGVTNIEGDHKESLFDVVKDFSQDGHNVTLNLFNNATLVLQNIGPVGGNTVQDLEHHLLSITHDLLVQK